MKTVLICLLSVSVLAATAWTSSVLGYRKGLAAQPPSVANSFNQESWQYQTFDYGKNATSTAPNLSSVINAFGAQQFEPCAAPTGVFPTGVDPTRLMWFRRQANPFTPSLRLPVYPDQLASSN
jgi:hypothetical protein